MRVKTCRVMFIGHRDVCVCHRLEERLYAILCDLLRNEVYVEFYLGRNGEFDLVAASLVRTARKVCGRENSELILVLPYVGINVEYYEQYYDQIIVPQCVEGLHPKGAITKRNRWMVEECDRLICYVDHKGGGAYSAMQYAQSLGKTVVNLASEETWLE